MNQPQAKDGPARRHAPRIPDYDLLRCVGRGAFGEVWLARSAIDTYRAVKLVYRRSFEQEQPYEREFTGIRKFDPVSRTHAGLVHVLHVGRNDAEGYFYYVMELADAAHAAAEGEGPQGSGEVTQAAASTAADYAPKTLKTELANHGQLPWDECVEVGLVLTSALDHLHQHGLVHRDIKPANIIIVNGRPKLADIGLVTSVTSAESFVGTSGYIPPEGPGTPQADIYSLGKVLYEMATGNDRLKFPELPDGFLDPPGAARNRRLYEIICKACDDNLQRRYASAQEMHADLDRLRRGHLPNAAAAARAWRRAYDFVWQRPGQAGLAVLVLIAIVTLLRLCARGQGPLPDGVISLPAAEVLKIAYTGQLPDSQTNGGAPRLQFELLAQRQGEARFTPLKDGAVLRSGVDHYQLLLRPLSAGYLYIFQVDTSGHKQWLFPENKTSTNSWGVNPVQPGGLLRLPPKERSEGYFLDEHTGVEHVYAVFSAVRWPELESALTTTSPQFAQSSPAHLARTVQAPNGLRYRGVGGMKPKAEQPAAPLKVVFEASGSTMVIERWFQHAK